MKSTAGVKVYLAGCGGVKNGCVASPVSGILARRFINDALGSFPGISNVRDGCPHPPGRALLGEFLASVARPPG